MMMCLGWAGVGLGVIVGACWYVIGQDLRSDR